MHSQDNGFSKYSQSTYKPFPAEPSSVKNVLVSDYYQKLGNKGYMTQIVSRLVANLTLTTEEKSDLMNYVSNSRLSYGLSSSTNDEAPVSQDNALLIYLGSRFKVSLTENATQFIRLLESEKQAHSANISRYRLLIERHEEENRNMVAKFQEEKLKFIHIVKRLERKLNDSVDKYDSLKSEVKASDIEKQKSVFDFNDIATILRQKENSIVELKENFRSQKFKFMAQVVQLGQIVKSFKQAFSDLVINRNSNIPVDKNKKRQSTLEDSPKHTEKYCRIPSFQKHESRRLKDDTLSMGSLDFGAESRGKFDAATVGSLLEELTLKQNLLNNIEKTKRKSHIEHQTYIGGPVRSSSNDHPYNPNQSVKEILIRKTELQEDIARISKRLNTAYSQLDASLKLTETKIISCYKKHKTEDLMNIKEMQSFFQSKSIPSRFLAPNDIAGSYLELLNIRSIIDGKRKMADPNELTGRQSPKEIVEEELSKQKFGFYEKEKEIHSMRAKVVELKDLNEYLIKEVRNHEVLNQTLREELEKKSKEAILAIKDYPRKINALVGSPSPILIQAQEDLKSQNLLLSTKLQKIEAACIELRSLNKLLESANFNVSNANLRLKNNIINLENEIVIDEYLNGLSSGFLSKTVESIDRASAQAQLSRWKHRGFEMKNKARAIFQAEKQELCKDISAYEKLIKDREVSHGQQLQSLRNEISDVSQINRKLATQCQNDRVLFDRLESSHREEICELQSTIRMHEHQINSLVTENERYVASLKLTKQVSLESANRKAIRQDSIESADRFKSQEVAMKRFMTKHLKNFEELSHQVMYLEERVMKVTASFGSLASKGSYTMSRRSDLFKKELLKEWLQTRLDTIKETLGRQIEKSSFNNSNIKRLKLEKMEVIRKLLVERDCALGSFQNFFTEIYILLGIQGRPISGEALIFEIRKNMNIRFLFLLVIKQLNITHIDDKLLLEVEKIRESRDLSNGNIGDLVGMSKSNKLISEFANNLSLMKQKQHFFDRVAEKSSEPVDPSSEESIERFIGNYNLCITARSALSKTFGKPFDQLTAHDIEQGLSRKESNSVFDVKSHIGTFSRNIMGDSVINEDPDFTNDPKIRIVIDKYKDEIKKIKGSLENMTAENGTLTDKFFQHQEEIYILKEELLQKNQELEAIREFRNSTDNKDSGSCKMEKSKLRNLQTNIKNLEKKLDLQKSIFDALNLNTNDKELKEKFVQRINELKTSPQLFQIEVATKPRNSKKYNLYEIEEDRYLNDNLSISKSNIGSESDMEIKTLNQNSKPAFKSSGKNKAFSDQNKINKKSYFITSFVNYDKKESPYNIGFKEGLDEESLGEKKIFKNAKNEFQM
jgi:hypothetical protein